MSLVPGRIEDFFDEKFDISNPWEMANIGPEHTGLPTLIHTIQRQLRHSPRVKIQLDPGRPNRKNSVSVSIHEPQIVKGRNYLVSKFLNSSHHDQVKKFIRLNKESLLLHARGDISDDDLRKRLRRA